MMSQVCEVKVEHTPLNHTVYIFVMFDNLEVLLDRVETRVKESSRSKKWVVSVTYSRLSARHLGYSVSTVEPELPSDIEEAAQAIIRDRVRFVSWSKSRNNGSNT